MNLSNRLQKHMVAATAVAAGIAAGAQAAIVYQSVSINIPDNIDGVYLNVVTLQATTASTATYDINPYTAAAGAFNLWGPTANTWFAVGGNYNLAFNTSIGGAAALFTRPGGTSVAPNFTLNSNQNLLGFRFVNEAMGNQVQFGWIRIQFGASYGVRTITEIAYDNTGGNIGAGVVPAPGALALLGLAGLAGRRRRS